MLKITECNDGLAIDGVRVKCFSSHGNSNWIEGLPKFRTHDDSLARCMGIKGQLSKVNFTELESM